MKLNFRPTSLAFLDFETQSEADLKNGSYKYMRHPSTRALTCVVKADGVIHKFNKPHEQKEQLQQVCAGHTIVAHNASFDAAVWETVLGLPPVEWLDTLPMARAAGLPGGLDKLSLAIGGRGKDKNGERLIQMLCILKPGKRAPAYGPAHELLMDYNVQDVEELELVYSRVKGFGEPDVMTVDRVVNERGIPINRSTLNALVSMYDENSRRFGGEFSEHTGDINPKSTKQVRAWLLERGVVMPQDSVSKPSVQAFLSAPEECFMGDNPDAEMLEAVKEALELRREIAGVGRGKVDAACRLIDPDDRIRDQFVYGAAGPGRWTSRGLQLHNMPSALKAVDVRGLDMSYEAFRGEAERASAETQTHVTVSDTLNIALRRIVEPTSGYVTVADYGAVEARGVAWVADCKSMLETYKDPNKSIYIDMGSVVFQRRISKKVDIHEYILSKALVLGCGYGMSGAKFDVTCRLRESRDTIAVLERANIKLADSVKLYRKTYPEIVAVWKTYHDAAHLCVDGVDLETGRCRFKMVNGDMHVVLPSDRPIVFRNARIELRVPMYCKMYNMPEVAVPTVIYDGQRGEGFLYGSKLCENIVQGICRDLLASSLVKAEEAGLKPVLHVHDEIACDCNDLDTLLEIMSVGPVWAKDFPILVEGYVGPQWSKVSHGYKEKRMLDGREV